MKVAIHTLGCKVNSYESSAVMELFVKAGYQGVSFDDIADIYIINTCSVTNQSDAKSRKFIRQAIRKNPSAVVVVMGCYAQMNSKEVESILGVDIVIGTNEKGKIFELVNEYLKNKQPINNVDDISKVRDFENLEATEFDHTRAFLKIQDGCNNFCSYCIIPYARGRVRSRAKDDVIKQAKEIVSKGYKEIVLAGIHTGGYGVDINYPFSKLIKDILLEVKGLERLRISSIEINQIDDDLLEILKNDDRLCKHFHLPIQSGADSVLKAMNRHYDTKAYLNKINHIKEYCPNISITTDIIIGFPTETDEDFKETIETVKKAQFSFMHIFPYSKRSGTVSAKYKSLNGKIVQKRLDEISNLNNQMALKYALKFENKTLDFIPESFHDGKLVGHTSNFLKVEVEGNEQLIGKKVLIIIKKSGFPQNFGEIL